MKTRPGKKSFSAKENIEIRDIRLTDDFKAALDLMANGEDCQFITGRAGTGKSTLLRYFRATTAKNVVVLAPTGIAAINVGGQTIHSFFQFPPRFIQENDVKLLGKNKSLIEKMETHIIDEASMVRADVMDGIDLSLRMNRSSHKPFGGVKVILIGDLYQLPPVIGQDMNHFFERIYPSPFFFSARVFGKINMGRYELTHIFRQSDPKFISLLNNIRENKHTEEDMTHLNSRLIEDDFDEEEVFVVLTATNDAASRINAYHLAKIQDQPYHYRANVAQKFEEKEYPNDFSLALKKGAQVMMIKNDVEKKRWVNGTLGFVQDLTESMITVNIDGDIHEVVRHRWEKIQYIFNEEADHIEPNVIGTFEQFPLKLAWAITIHKSQGQTFDEVVIDVGHGAFAHGQVYVALSRCTKLEGIRLKKKIRPSDILFDRRVLEFHQN